MHPLGSQGPHRQYAGERRVDATAEADDDPARSRGVDGVENEICQYLGGELGVEPEALAEGYVLSASALLKGKVQVIKKNGRPEYAVLPYVVYERLVRAAKMSRR